MRKGNKIVDNLEFNNNNWDVIIITITIIEHLEAPSCLHPTFLHTDGETFQAEKNVLCQSRPQGELPLLAQGK